VEHLRLVRENLDARGIEYRYLDGSTPAEQRRAEVQAFQDGGGELFLISLRAGGTGLDLTAADYVIHLDPWWNPAVEAQASDRAHRIGQERPVTIYRLVTAGTVEERILALHGEKRSTAERLLDGTDAPTPVDLETLRSLVA
jgi:SNF2 family DNA or RNA helicase